MEHLRPAHPGRRWNICGQLILVGDAWDESHDPEGPPRCFGGMETGVARRACNRRHGAEVVRLMDAKATHNRQKHIGAFQTRHKLPGGAWIGESARSTEASLRGLSEPPDKAAERRRSPSPDTEP
jgi:hypothetical protein